MKGVGLLLAAFCLFSGAQGQQNTVIRTETSVVLVDAIVTGKNGAYIRDLTAKDFHLFQDNKEQAITSFSFESPAAALQPRSVVLFFDASTMEAADQPPTRQAAAQLIDAETGPNRKMAVVSYDGALHVRQNFTDNAGRLKDALPQPRSTSHAGPIDDSGSRNMLQSLGNLARSLGVLPGRKIIVLFAGALPVSSIQRSNLAKAVEACNRSGVAVYPLDVRPMSVQIGSLGSPGAVMPGAGFGAPVGDPYSNAGPDSGRSDRSGGLHGAAEDSDAGTTGSRSVGQQFLVELADRTGGFFIRNSNDLSGGLRKIAGEQNEYYALTFTPPDAQEGACHTLRVKVDRSGATVRARNSYCATKPLDLLASTSISRDLEKRAAEAQPGNMTASIALPYFYNSPTVARVHVAAEIMPGALKFERQGGKLHAEINLLGIASTEDGGVRARFSDVLRFDFENDTQIASWRSKPLHYEKEFRIVPGQYKFTMAFGAGNQSDTGFGKVEMPLAIGAWSGQELGMSGIVLSREIRPAADLGLDLSLGDQVPLVAGATQVVPFGSVRFTKSEPGYFYFEVYDPDSSSVSLRVRALDAGSGSVAWDSGPDKLPIPANDGRTSIPILARLPLDALPAGSWRLEVVASSVAGKAIARTVDFEIP